MEYQTITADAEKCSASLKVIEVDTSRSCVKVRSTDKDLSVAHHQLSSDDAKSLALRAAVKEGFYEPAIKHATLMYGDDKTGKAAVQVSASNKSSFRPFLVVEFVSETLADMQFTGDSL